MTVTHIAPAAKEAKKNCVFKEVDKETSHVPVPHYDISGGKLVLDYFTRCIADLWDENFGLIENLNSSK